MRSKFTFGKSRERFELNTSLVSTTDSSSNGECWYVNFTFNSTAMLPNVLDECKLPKHIKKSFSQESLENDLGLEIRESPTRERDFVFETRQTKLLDILGVQRKQVPLQESLNEMHAIEGIDIEKPILKAPLHSIENCVLPVSNYEDSDKEEIVKFENVDSPLICSKRKQIMICSNPSETQDQKISELNQSFYEKELDVIPHPLAVEIGSYCLSSHEKDRIFGVSMETQTPKLMGTFLNSLSSYMIKEVKDSEEQEVKETLSVPNSKVYLRKGFFKNKHRKTVKTKYDVFKEYFFDNIDQNLQFLFKINLKHKINIKISNFARVGVCKYCLKSLSYTNLFYSKINEDLRILSRFLNNILVCPRKSLWNGNYCCTIIVICLL
ncbi:uncharacterized protein LOC129907426 [Episyrphus balteatus]|uniref:uncharacterized protein LOC129907426 n=1 Tax=Episyrphus balteatus TaxID=286459 RepID=UPI0024867494|nr:uncharacterized protein LOC129907426 [Episyrphus balteatus]